MTIDIGIVVPTLGIRAKYLRQCLEAIRLAGPSYVVLVCPKNRLADLDFDLDSCDLVLDDPGLGLADAINVGMRAMPPHIRYVNWIGDDDLLTPLSLTLSREILLEDVNNVLVYGICRYIDANGRTLGVNKSKIYAAMVLPFGPDLIPQPGALFRRDIFSQVGELDVSLKYAFDFDLFLKFKKIGGIRFLNCEVASFRWHADSLSVAGRWNAVLEAKRVRESHRGNLLRFFLCPLELLVLISTYSAGMALGLKAFIHSR